MMIRHLRPRTLALAGLLVAAPLPFASVAPGPATALLLATLAALVLALWTAGTDPLPRELLIAGAALAGVALLGWLQSLPAPAAITAALAPESFRLSRQANELAGAGATADTPADNSRSRFVPLSLAPEASRSAAFDWLLPAAALFAAARIGSSRRVRRTLGIALFVSATVQIAIGAAMWISRSDTLWGIAIGPAGSRVRGTFINPDHLAFLLEIALALAFAWLWWSTRRTLLGADRAEERLLRIGPPALAFLLVFAGLVLTGSRAALASVLVATAVQGAVVGSQRGRRWLLGAGLAVGLAGSVALLALGAEGAFERLSLTAVDEVTGGERVEAAEATFDLFRRFPLTGSGLGSFQAAFPLVQPTSLFKGLWRHAHSDWIELLATTGIFGAALVATGLFFYGSRLRQVILFGERSEDRAAGVAALGALVAVGFHSCFDFGLTMPANAFALAVVAGAAGATRVVKKAT